MHSYVKMMSMIIVRMKNLEAVDLETPGFQCKKRSKYQIIVAVLLRRKSQRSKVRLDQLFEDHSIK